MGASGRTVLLHINAVPFERIDLGLSSTVKRQSIRAGSGRTRECWLCRGIHRSVRVASLRLSFPSTYSNRARSLSGGCRPSGPSRFDVRTVLAVLSRHSYSQATDVTRARDRGSELDHAPPASFLDGVPLSVPKGFGLADPLVDSSH